MTEARALQIVEAALTLDDHSQRADFVARECGDDAALLARVHALLAHDETGFRLMPTESFARPLSVIDHIPDRIGPYRVTGEIARGGMGAVVRAERDDGVFSQTVAIKLIRADLASARAKARFAEERRILAMLRHPGIVRIIDGGDAEARPWLAMDFVEGLPIDIALQRKAADTPTRLDAFEAVCEAVAHAHRQLIVHADIKPSNVLMSDDGSVHLLDFGIARLIAAIDSDEEGDPYPLTKGYAAPERAVGVAPTIASDLFSLGVLLLAVLDKSVPGDGVEFEPGTRLPRGVLNGDLAAIAARCLSEKPEDRYADVPALLDDVRRHRASKPVCARGEAGWAYRSSRFIRRNRRVVIVGSLVALALTATTAVTSVQYVRAEKAREEADARFGEVRSLARFLLFDAYDRLADAPGTVEVRAALADTARDYLDRLRSVPGASPALQLDLARSFRRLAAIQGVSGTSNLGRPQDARISLQQADALLAPLARADPHNPGVLVERGWIALSRWSLTSDTRGAAYTAAATRDFAAALRLRPDDAEAQLGKLTAARDAAYDLGTADQHARALAVATAALAELRRFRFPERWRTEARILEVTLLNRIGDATYYSDDAAGALAAYREGRALALAELSKAPSVRWEDRLAEADYNVGSTMADMPGQQQAALNLTDSAVARLRGVLATGADAGLEMRLIILLGEKAIILQQMGRNVEAADVSAQQMTMREARLAAQPDDVTRVRDLAIALAAHADMLAEVGRRTQACAASAKGLGLMDRMAETGDLAARDRRIDYEKLQAAHTRYCR